MLLGLALIGCMENLLLLQGKKQKYETPTVFTDMDGGAAEDDDENIDEPGEESEPTDEEGPTSENETSEEPAWEPGWIPPHGPSEEPGDEPADEIPFELYAPGTGDMIINELMINPENVSDQQGEWVELWNTTSVHFDLLGYHFADDGVDDDEIEEVTYGSLIVEPEGFLLICVDDDYWSNGGIECDGVVHYTTFGGGFALSNSDDEVLLQTATGATIDRVVYHSGFAPLGASMGVSPANASESGNDNTDNWCDQWDFLPQGDNGNPDEENDWCW